MPSLLARKDSLLVTQESVTILIIPYSLIPIGHTTDVPVPVAGKLRPVSGSFDEGRLYNRGVKLKGELDNAICGLEAV